jgi:hypothetical protein
MVFNATLNNISVIIVAVSFIGGGNRRNRRKPTLSHNVVDLALMEIRTHISGDRQ